MSLSTKVRSRVIDILFAAALAASTPAFANETHQFNVPAEDAPDAIREFASQAHVQILVADDNVKDKRLHAVSGELSTDQGLRLLLADSGLQPQYVGDRSIALVTASQAASIARDETHKEGKKGSSSGFRTAQVGQGANSQSAVVGGVSSTGENDSERTQLQEIVVTATKREERLLDAPQSVTVLSGDALSKLGAVQFRDFANTVPGLTFTTTGAGFTQISLRGVTLGRDIGPTVGIYVDEVPYGSSSRFGGGVTNTLDMGLFDVERIEVLPGPQGTLYGASTMGGLIKYVTKPPNTESFSGDVQTGVSDTGDGDGVNYNVSGAVNVPIVTDKVALRASAFESHDGGYIDNVALRQSDVNRSDTYGGRLDLLVRPTQALSIRITGFLQNISRDGEADADYNFAGTPLYGSLDQYRKYAEPFEQRVRLISGTVTYAFGSAMLTSISSYQAVRTETVEDLSPSYVPYCVFESVSCSAVGYSYGLFTNGFKQEVRLAGSTGKPFEWLIGGFYTHERSGDEEALLLRDLAGGPAPNNLFTYSQPAHYEEYAAFGDITWHLTNKVDVTGGVRYARNRQTFEQIGSGLFGSSKPPSSATDNVPTYLATTRYHFSDHATGYLRYATGYRPGGPNVLTRSATTALPVGQPTFEADKLKNYEVGFKAETADRRFEIDLAGYYIDWSNIQTSVVRGGFNGIINAPGGARIQGTELTLTARPGTRFLMTGAFAYQRAYMSEANADLGNAKGERLPNVPRFTAALNVDYELSAASWRPTVGATLRYTGERKVSFDKSTSSPQYTLPEYTVVDLRNSYVLGRVNMQLYVHNLFDERGQLSAYTWQGLPRPAILQPRTIGISATVPF